MIEVWLRLWLLLFWAGGAAAICPEECKCGLNDRGYEEVLCDKGGMAGLIPVKEMDLDMEVLTISAPPDAENSLTIGPIFQKFKRLKELHVVYSNVPAIGRHSFWGVPTLKVLNLTHNNISQVLDHNFRGLLNLMDLHLDNNRIESMGSGTFQHLVELRTLTLTNNRISHLSPRLFLMLGKLKKLDLSYNNLEHLDPDVFKDVQELRVFACRECGLRNMNPHIYSLLSSLTHLDLGNNEFKYLDTDEFRDLRKLQVMKIDGNHFPVILEGTFGSQTRLESLDLSKSRIAKVTTHAFANLTSLIELDLSYNKLGKLEPATFTPLANNLKVLSVSGNNIDITDFTYVLQVATKLKELSVADMAYSSMDLPLGMFAQLENLRFLNMSGNEMMHFPVQLLSPVFKLNELDLSRNKFHGLDERLVSRLENVQTIHLDNNPWACDLCHITPMIARVNMSNSMRKVVCALPYNMKGRTLGSLSVKSLGWCGSGLGYREEGFAGLALTHNTQLGLIAAGAAVALLVITLAAVIAGLLYNRHHAAYYYTQEEKRGPENDAIYKNGVDSNKKVAIATIDEITKDPELQVLANGT